MFIKRIQCEHIGENTSKTFAIQSFEATDKTKISVLGHNGMVLEYKPEVDPAPQFRNTGNGMEITVMRAQRIYNNRQWNNPIVVKIEEIKNHN